MATSIVTPTDSLSAVAFVRRRPKLVIMDVDILMNIACPAFVPLLSVILTFLLVLFFRPEEVSFTMSVKGRERVVLSTLRYLYIN